MTIIMPLLLPAVLVDRHRIDLSARYSTGWSFQAMDVTAAPSGELYALYQVFRYDNGEQDPARGGFIYQMITRYSASGEALGTALADVSHGQGNPPLAGGGAQTLCVLPDGTLAAGGSPNSVTLLTPDLSSILARYDSHDSDRGAFMPPGSYTPGTPFASAITVTPSGRLLCKVAEYGVWRYGNVLDNLVGIADGPLTADSRPVIEAIASLDPTPAHHTDTDLRTHIQYQGRPIGREHRPRPALTELVAAEDRLSKWERSRLDRPVPLADDLFIVPFYAQTFRSGSRGQPFVHALLDDSGTMTGRLHGLDLHRDSPFTGHDWTVAADPHRGHAFHLNRYGLYAWNRDGVLRARLDATTKRFRALTRFTLTSCTPDGHLLLVHTTQHLILRVPVPDDLTTLPDTVEDALLAYSRQRTARKKLWAPVNWHWTDDHTANTL
ncbi:hypothetical protein ACIP88_24605 [Streptomyces uncialis]|uniref:hypothetical protein n=1 Tax=Streptomyces uncialis TaxID=1048205 RepID=UPI0037F35306